MAGQNGGTDCVNLFNLIAELVVHVRELNPEGYQNRDVRKTIVPPPELSVEVVAIFKEYPCLKDGKHLIMKGVPVDVVSAIKNWEYYDSFLYVLEFLVQLTRISKVGDIIRYAAAAKRAGGFDALNDNVRETGVMVLPKVKSISDSLEPGKEDDAEDDGADGPPPNGKHWATERLAGINEELSNIYYIETEKLEINETVFSAQHHIFEGSLILEGRKDIVIGVSPLLRGEFLDVGYETRAENGGTRNYFSVSGLKEVETLREKLAAVMLEACARDVDILVFPEMFGSNEICDESFIAQIADQAADAGLPMPPLIILPTWWHDHSNELYVRDGSGDLVCIQQKQYPFIYPDTETGRYYAEDLQFAERVIHVVHIPKLGRLTFPICRDYLEPGYLSFMAEVLRSTILLCPSYSGGKTQFDLSAPGQIKYGCYTVWINSCAANRDPEHCPEYVGMVSGPLAEKYVEHLKPSCGGVCGGQQDACLFVVQISLDHEANISYTHVHGGSV